MISAITVNAQIECDLETGAVFSGYNDVRIPGDNGTKFSLSEELNADPAAFFRIGLTLDFNPRHHLKALYAPLSINSTGTLDRDLIFTDEMFSARTPIETQYRFNSYRLTYRYDFLRKEKLQLGAGFTAKIRDAEISVKGGGKEASKTNVGFVPIIHFRVFYKMTDRFGFLLEGDALAAPQGRAEDVLAALTFRATNAFDLKLGYRILEGGADNDEVYNFALIHYASLGTSIRF
ncbi:MAG: hypothetical protein U5R06_06450 [candidate division KSB1 bacterium]|nr:hypothetical protein [candidate division KSB1 bacterium]